MNDYGGDWGRCLPAVYGVFRRDFTEAQAEFRGYPVRVAAQMIDGKERTFWHLSSEGAVEQYRTPDLRRCERIGWVRSILDHERDPAILSWPQTRGRKQRQVLWLMDFHFAVVIERRPDCWWLWTAYPTDRPRTQRKLMREYEAWRNANAAP
jgi:hypothetical protein